MAQEKTKAKTTCQDVINACDKTIADKNKALELSDIAITNLKAQNGSLSVEIDSLRDSSSAWYHNPWVMGLFGVALGVTLKETVFK